MTSSETKQDDIIEMLGSPKTPGFSIPSYDRIDATYPSSTQEVYTYSLSSVIVNTITVTYTDSTKSKILNVVKT